MLYYRMTGNALTMDEARDYERRLKAPRVLSFAELKELIESGRVDQIPNNKFIPEKLSVSTSPMKLMAATLMHCTGFRRRPLANPLLLRARNLGRLPRSRKRRQRDHGI